MTTTQIKKLQDLDPYVLNPGDVPGEGDFMPVVDMDGDANKAGEAVPVMRKLELQYLKNLMLSLTSKYGARMLRTGFENFTGYKAPESNTKDAQDGSSSEVSGMADAVNRIFTYINDNLIDINTMLQDRIDSKGEIFPYAYVNPDFIRSFQNTVANAMSELDPEKVFPMANTWLCVRILEMEDPWTPNPTLRGLLYCADPSTTPTVKLLPSADGHSVIDVIDYYDGSFVASPVTIETPDSEPKYRKLQKLTWDSGFFAGKDDGKPVDDYTVYLIGEYLPENTFRSLYIYPHDTTVTKITAPFVSMELDWSEVIEQTANKPSLTRVYNVNGTATQVDSKSSYTFVDASENDVPKNPYWTTAPEPEAEDWMLDTSSIFLRYYTPLEGISRPAFFAPSDVTVSDADYKPSDLFYPVSAEKLPAGQWNYYFSDLTAETPVRVKVSSVSENGIAPDMPGYIEHVLNFAVTPATPDAIVLSWHGPFLYGVKGDEEWTRTLEGWDAKYISYKYAESSKDLPKWCVNRTISGTEMTPAQLIVKGGYLVLTDPEHDGHISDYTYSYDATHNGVAIDANFWHEYVMGQSTEEFLQGIIKVLPIGNKNKD